MKRRAAVIDKVVKMLRLASGAGTEAEAHTALTLAQKLMYAHGIAEHELEEERGELDPIEDRVVDQSGHRVVWKEYLAAIIAENFRCAYVLSASRSSGVTRLVFLGRASDVAVAAEAYQASAIVGTHLAEECALTRAPSDRSDAREAFLTGFLKGLLDRFDESASSSALLVVAESAVVAHAAAFVNAPPPDRAAASDLPMRDGGALREGFESGYAHGGGARRVT